MFPGHSHDIRIENDPNAAELVRLAALDSAVPIATPALIAHIGGRPAAALSLVDDRVVADPFQRTEIVCSVLRLRARGIRAAERRPSVRERVLTELRRSMGTGRAGAAAAG